MIKIQWLQLYNELERKMKRKKKVEWLLILNIIIKLKDQNLYYILNLLKNKQIHKKY